VILAAVSASPRVPGSDEARRIRAAAADFEAVFLAQVFRAMRRTVPRSGILGASFGEGVYREMLDSQYARSLAYAGGTGLGEMLARELGGEAAARARPEPSLPVSSALHWPASGRVTSGFGPRTDPLSGAPSFHTGIDLAAAAGTLVYAAAPGRVVAAGSRGGYGNVVVLDHGDGTQTLYAHNEALLVPVGATVEAGDPIARAGTTGRSTGPHLHFEVRRGGVPVDPRTFLPGGR
jgi:murein DD-endopeptidase MepM/ murein hydrolase activator NlpD